MKILRVYLSKNLFYLGSTKPEVVGALGRQKPERDLGKDGANTKKGSDVTKGVRSWLAVGDRWASAF